MTREKGFKGWQERYEAKRQRESYRVRGLRASSVAAALTQKELAGLVGSSQTIIADLETWDEASLPMIERLCEALKVAPEDLIYRASVENTDSEDVQERSAESTFQREIVERRCQVNRIKSQEWRLDYVPAIRLGGLKARRLEAGLSQRKLARMVGTNQTTIFEFEKRYANRGAYIKTIRKLCEVLQVSPADLICRD